MHDNPPTVSTPQSSRNASTSARRVIPAKDAISDEDDVIITGIKVPKGPRPPPLVMEIPDAAWAQLRNIFTSEPNSMASLQRAANLRREGAPERDIGPSRPPIRRERRQARSAATIETIVISDDDAKAESEERKPFANGASSAVKTTHEQASKV